MKLLTITASTLIIFSFRSQLTPVRARINHAHWPLTHGSPLIPPTLPILLHLALIRYLPGPRDPQTGNVYMELACLFGSRFPSLYNALVVHSSLPTLLLCFPCFAVSRHFARCSVNCRLLPNHPPIATLNPYNSLLAFITGPITLVPGHTPGLVPSLLFLPYINLHVFLYIPPTVLYI
jgi:hypothetical protein